MTECTECGGREADPIHNGQGKHAHGFAPVPPSPESDARLAEIREWAIDCTKRNPEPTWTVEDWRKCYGEDVCLVLSRMDRTLSAHTAALARAGAASVEALVGERDAMYALLGKAHQSMNEARSFIGDIDDKSEGGWAYMRVTKALEALDDRGIDGLFPGATSYLTSKGKQVAAALAPREPASPQAAPAASDPAEPECIPPYPNFGSVGGGSGLEMKSQREWEAKYGPPPGEPGSRVEVSSDGNLRRKQ
jgi:hypothetical protein